MKTIGGSQYFVDLDELFIQRYSVWDYKLINFFFESQQQAKGLMKKKGVLA